MPTQRKPARPGQDSERAAYRQEVLGLHAKPLWERTMSMGPGNDAVPSIWAFVENCFNGILIKTHRPDLMGKELTRLYQHPDEIDRFRRNAALLRQSCQTLEARWPIVKDFLDLNDTL